MLLGNEPIHIKLLELQDLDLLNEIKENSSLSKSSFIFSLIPFLLLCLSFLACICLTCFGESRTPDNSRWLLQQRHMQRHDLQSRTFQQELYNFESTIIDSASQTIPSEIVPSEFCNPQVCNFIISNSKLCDRQCYFAEEV